MVTARPLPLTLCTSLFSSEAPAALTPQPGTSRRNCKVQGKPFWRSFYSCQEDYFQSGKPEHQYRRSCEHLCFQLAIYIWRTGFSSQNIFRHFPQGLSLPEICRCIVSELRDLSQHGRYWQESTIMFDLVFNNLPTLKPGVPRCMWYSG